MVKVVNDLISRADAIEAVCGDCTIERKDKCKADGYCYEVKNLMALPSAETHEIRTETHGVCLIRKDDAMGAVQDHFNADGFKGYDDGQKMMDRIKALPSADAVDCTDFIEWLVDRVLDETIWEYNSVAYGEIICRKLEKLGVLEVTEEPCYYIRPSTEPKTGEWIFNPKDAIELMFTKPKCSECGFESSDGGNFCSNCGTRMKGGAK